MTDFSISTTKYKPCQSAFANAVNKFVYSKWFIVAFAVLTTLSNVFALDIFYFALATAFAVYIAIFGKDFSPYMAMLCFCYVASSVENNPGNNPNSILYPSNSGYIIFYFAAAVILSMLVRFILDRDIGFAKMVFTKRKLSLGFIILAISYAISGIGSLNYNDYALNNVLFALLQFATLFVPYFILSFAIKWEEIEKDYLAFTGIMLGLTVGVELLAVYNINEVINKGDIYTGWGISNNIGAFISIMLPFTFYYICNKKHTVLNVLALDFMCVTVILTSSRTAMLAMTLILVAGNVICFIKAKPWAKILCACNLLVIIAVEVIFLFIVYSNINELIGSSARTELYKEGLKVFYNYPLFGDGWYSLNKICTQNPEYLSKFGWMWSTEESFLSFFPGRWHNTVIQLLATCGLVGLGAYIFHRVQTVTLAFKRKSSETLFLCLSVILLLFQSLLDCHFFNLGPVLFYSVALAFIEFRNPE